jgi:hypothetical protein
MYCEAAMHAPSFRGLTSASALATIAAIAGCSADSSMRPDNTPGAVTFSVASSPASSTASASRSVTPSGSSLVIARGGDTLQLDSVNVVFARVVLRQAADTSCGGESHDDAVDHECAELKSGPILVSLPLVAGAQTVFSVPAPTGTYTGLSLSTHKPKRGDSGSNVQAFLAAHPEYENTSIRVVGKFRGVAFTWRGDPEAKLDEEFSPPLAVTAASGLSITLRVDVASWFTSPTGGLLDPQQTSYPTIARNIKNSFKAFEDEKHSGNDDHDTGRRP